MDVSGDAAVIVSMNGKSSSIEAVVQVKSCFIASALVFVAALNSVYLMMIIISSALIRSAEDPIRQCVNPC